MGLTIKNVKYIDSAANERRYQVNFNERPDLDHHTPDDKEALRRALVNVYQYGRIYLDANEGVVMVFTAQDEMDAYTQALRILEDAYEKN